MDALRKHIDSLPEPQRRVQIDQFIQLFQQHNVPPIAQAFSALKNCYPVFPFFKPERQFREYLAWCDLYDYNHHPIVRQLAQRFGGS
jgi:hypothetical protein